MTLFEEQRIPWEHQKTLGRLNALGKTFVRVMRRPGYMFDGLDRFKSLWFPFSFYMIVSFASFFVGIVVQALFDKYYQYYLNITSFSLAVALVPFLIAASYGVFALLFHAAVRMLGGTAGLRGTLHVIGYTAAASVCGIIPFVGQPVYAVWATVIAVAGFKRVHHLSTWRAIVACCAPFVAIALTAVGIGLLVSRVYSPRRNEMNAQQAVQQISSAINAYALAHMGAYPSSESVLRYGKPEYLSRAYDGTVIGGYRYSLNLDAHGYEVVAAPYDCGRTGTMVYIARTGGVLTSTACDVP
jgi:hypothetical protein